MATDAFWDSLWVILWDFLPKPSFGAHTVHKLSFQLRTLSGCPLKSFLLFSDEVCNSKWSYKSLKFLQSPSLGWLFMHTQILPDSIRRMTIILCSLLQFPHLSKTYILAPSDIGRKWNVHKTFSEPCLYIQLTSFVQGDRTIFRESSPLHFFM